MAWDRSASLSRVLAVLFALHFAYAHGLWTPSTVGTFVGHIASRYGGYSAPIYSLVHHRPMEVCDTYVADKTGHMAAVAATPAAGPSWQASVALLGAYDADARALMLAPCRGQWVFQPGSGAHLFAQFARDAWSAWLFERFGITEATAALFLMVWAMVGAFGVARLAFFLSGSTVASLVLVAIVAAIDRSLAPWFTPINLFAWYGFSTAWLLVMCTSRPERSTLASLALVPAAAVNILGYLMAAHSSAFLSVGVMLLLFGAAVAARPSRGRVAALATTVLLVGAGLYDCSQFVQRQLAPISSANFASAGSFGEFALTTGFWTERPNPWSYPQGDAGVFAAVAAEPMIWASAPATFEYQGFSRVGRQLLTRMLADHPLIFLDNAWRRMALMVARLPSLARPTYRIVPTAIESARALAALALLLAVGALLRRSAWGLELPIVGIAAWNFFGLETLTHVVHTHTNYLIVGLLQLLMLAPLLAWILAVQARAAFAGGRRVVVGRRKWPLSIALAAILLGGPYAVRSMQRELATFDIWYQPWLGKDVRPSKEGLLTDSLAARIEGLRAYGEVSPGSISMYGAWTMSRLATEVWTPSLGEKLAMTASEATAQQQRAAALSVEYFRRAQAEAPDDPWVPTFAWILDPASAGTLYQRELVRQPRGIFSAWFAKYLFQTVPGGQKFGDQFEDLTHEQLASSVDVRPGLELLPRVTVGERAVASPNGNHVRLLIEPGGSVVVGQAKGYATDRAKAFLFARVLRGSAAAALARRRNGGDAVGAEQPLAMSDMARYRFFEWAGGERIDGLGIRITAGTDGAEIDVRDFYPLIENPHHLAW